MLLFGGPELSATSRSALIGMEPTWNCHWFVELLAQLGHESWVGDVAKIRASDPWQPEARIGQTFSTPLGAGTWHGGLPLCRGAEAHSDNEGIRQQACVGDPSRLGSARKLPKDCVARSV